MNICLIIVVKSLSHLWLFATPWTAAHQASMSLTISWSLPKCTSIESVMLSSHLILCFPLLFLSSILPNIGGISNESALHIRWPMFWSFRFSSSPFNEYSSLISLRINLFDLQLGFTGLVHNLISIKLYKFKYHF